MQRLESLRGPVVDRKRLTTMSSARVARERQQKTFMRQLKKRVAILRKVSIFKEMPLEEVSRGAELFIEETVECGSFVIRQGDIGDEFFIISSGSALVLFHSSHDAPDKVLAKIGAGAFFGELALLTDEPRSASIMADPDGEGPLEVLKMVRSDFQQVFALSATLRSANSNLKERRAWEVLSSLSLFSSLPEAVVRDMVGAMKIVKYQPGTYVVQQGRQGKSFYVILEGIVKVTVNDPSHPANEKSVAELSDHDYFGEVALLSNEMIRTANIVTLTHVVCFSLDREVFVSAQNAAMAQELRRRDYFQALDDEAHFSSDGAGSGLPIGALGASTIAGLSFKRRLMRLAFRGLMVSLRDSLITRMFQRLCRSPHLTVEYGAIAAQAFLSCPDRAGFHRRLRAVLDKIRKKPMLARTLPELSLVVGVLAQCRAFSNVYCHDWPHAALIDFGHHVRVARVDRGDLIYDSSERATKCYVVVRGTVTILNGAQGTRQVPDEVEVEASGATVPKRTTFWQIQGDFVEKGTPGTILGAEALDEPVEARRVFYRHNAVALSDCLVLVFDYEDYYAIAHAVATGTVSDVEEKYKLIKAMGLFAELSVEQRYHVAYALKEDLVPRGKTVLSEGETARRISLIRSGSVTVCAGGINVTTLNKGEYFGESGVLAYGSAPGAAESVTAFAATPLELYVMEPVNYGLLDKRVLGRLKRNWRIRASWRKARVLKQRATLRLPALLAAQPSPTRRAAASFFAAAPPAAPAFPPPLFESASRPRLPSLALASAPSAPFRPSTTLGLASLGDKAGFKRR